MIEFSLLPFVTAVAAIALFAVTATMDIVATMAGKTVHRCFLVALVGVACGTQHFLVSIDQRKVGLTVIKFSLLPAFCDMAVGALLTEFALVNILFAMAVVAYAGCLTPEFSLLVTTAALSPAMASVQSEVGLGMVEKLAIKQYDLGVAAFVIGVTGAAAGIAHLGRATVIALAAIDVRCHLFMAIQAKFILRGFAEALVTAGAFAFFFSVPFDQLAGHQQFFDAGRRYRQRDDTQQQ